jgi:hypothetical protein
VERARLAKDSRDLYDYFDTTQHYLQLRQRGHSVSWFVRAKGRSPKIGNVRRAPGDPEFVSLSRVRQRAGEVYFAMKPRSAKDSPVNPAGPGRLDRQYQAAFKLTRKVGRKIKRPSQDTQNDVGLCFDKPGFERWRKIRLAYLTPLHLTTLLKDVHAARGDSACRKTLPYVKAALSWAHSEKTIESGLGAKMPWWANIKAPQPTAEEIERTEARQSALIVAKEAFTVEHAGELLVRHEQFCAERYGNKKISPGVRWGLWWLVLTATRRFTTTKLRCCDLQWNDPRNVYFSPDQLWGTPNGPPNWSRTKSLSCCPFRRSGFTL